MMYTNRTIYFNTKVSEFFRVSFGNIGEKCETTGEKILSCPDVSWDIDTKKTLNELFSKDLTLIGIGGGVWEIHTKDEQGKPDTENWNK